MFTIVNDEHEIEATQPTVKNSIPSLPKISVVEKIDEVRRPEEPSG
jgi:hypothetical protein